MIVAERKPTIEINSPEAAEDAIILIVSKFGWHLVFETLRTICRENIKMSRGSVLTQNVWTQNSTKLVEVIKFWERDTRK
jgi:hypothetical protein